MEIHERLHAMRDRRGTKVFDDANFASALQDFMVQPEVGNAELTLLTDAVRVGAVAEMQRLIANGGDPARAVETAGHFLTTQRRYDPRSACWACAAIGFALGDVEDSVVRAYLHPGAPSVTIGKPAVQGTPVVGAPLTVVVSDMTPDDADLTYEWKISDKAVGSGPWYTPKPADVGLPVSVTVTATRDDETASATSENSESVKAAGAHPDPVGGETRPAVVTVAKPMVTGTPVVGGTLTATTGHVSPADATVAFAWQIDGLAVSTNSSYSPTKSDANKNIIVTATATDPRTGQSGQESASVGPVRPRGQKWMAIGAIATALVVVVSWLLTIAGEDDEPITDPPISSPTSPEPSETIAAPSDELNAAEKALRRRVPVNLIDLTACEPYRELVDEYTKVAIYCAPGPRVLSEGAPEAMIILQDRDEDLFQQDLDVNYTTEGTFSEDCLKYPSVGEWWIGDRDKVQGITDCDVVEDDEGGRYVEFLWTYKEALVAIVALSETGAFDADARKALDDWWDRLDDEDALALRPQQ